MAHNGMFVKISFYKCIMCAPASDHQFKAKIVRIIIKIITIHNVMLDALLHHYH